MPAPLATHVDPVLTQISIDFVNADYVGKELFPVLPTNVPAGTYVKYSTKNKFKIKRSLIGPKSEAPMSDWEQGFDTFKCEYHAHGDAVSEIDNQWARVGNGAEIDQEVYATEFVKNLTLLEYEDRVAEVAKATATYGSNHDSPNTKWDADGGTPIADIKTAAAAMAVAPNLLILGKPVYDVLTEDASILDRIKHVGGGGFVTTQVLAKVFDVDQVIVAKARESFGGSYLWGNNAILCYRAPRIGPKVATFGLTFSPDGEDFIRNYVNDRIGRGAQVIESHWAYDIKVVAAQAGYLLSDVLTS